MSPIADNLKKIRENIAEAALRSGRNPEDITLVGVTKTVDIDKIACLFALGVKNLGESRAQELLAKYDAPELIIRQDRQDGAISRPNWHFIGHLQTNKVKQVVGKACLIQSVDSLRLAREINTCAGTGNIVADILIELNLAGEETKFGIQEEALYTLIQNIQELPNIRVKGLMTIAPYVENPRYNRNVFKKMSQIFIDIKDRYHDNVNIDIELLSMGMSNDYVTAIEEGANMVRIGTSLFGGRV